jgi:O-succinylbenzoic acid--CoA ligase
MTINSQDWLAHQTLTRPQGIALIHRSRSWTYAELNHVVSGLTGRLAAAGIERGQHVGVLMPNRVEYVSLIHALARLGAVLVPLNARLTPAELCYQLEQTGCRHLICSRETEDKVTALDQGRWQSLSVEASPDTGLVSLQKFSPEKPEQWRSRSLDLAAVQAIIHTSGTTGQPKGAMLTYANHFWGATASAFRLGTDPTDRWLLCMPLYHVGGLAIVWRCCLYGTTAVLQDRFEAAAVNRALDTQAISLVSLVPTMLQWLLEERGQRVWPSTLRCILLGGAAAPLDLLDRCRALALPVATTYGLTEAASQVATAPPDEVQHKPGCVGKPLMFTQIRVIGEDDQDRPSGEIGQIVVRGPTVMRGYYRQPQATGQTLANGELHTGDLGYLDEDSDLWVVQRRADLIVSGGENVYPSEVEQVLRAHSAVKAVCVVGVADEAWGQRVAAAVVLCDGASSTKAELIEFCRARLAGYKQPRVLHFVDSLPQTASGKIERRAVVRLMAALAVQGS